jgi:hypothetical protein
MLRSRGTFCFIEPCLPSLASSRRLGPIGTKSNTTVRSRVSIAPDASHWQFKCAKFFSNLMFCLGAGDAGDLPAVAAILPEDTNEPESAAF